MFVLSQLALSNTIFKNDPSNKSITTYTIAIGLVLYAAIYLYALMYYREMLPIVNQYLVYFVILDLLLAVFNTYRTLRKVGKGETLTQMFDEKSKIQKVSNENTPDSEDSSESLLDTESENDDKSDLTDINYDPQTGVEVNKAHESIEEDDDIPDMPELVHIEEQDQQETHTAPQESPSGTQNTDFTHENQTITPGNADVTVTSEVEMEQEQTQKKRRGRPPKAVLTI